MSRGVDTGCPTRYSREYRGYWKYSRQVCARLIIPLATSIWSSCSLCEYVSDWRCASLVFDENTARFRRGDEPGPIL